MKRLLTLSLAALLAAGLTACGAAEERGDLAAKPVVQLVTVLVCFPLLHALGSRSGIFPAFFPSVRREKAGRN